MDPQLISLIIKSSHVEAMLSFYGLLGLEFERKQISKGGECHKAFMGHVELTIYAIKEPVARGSSPDLQLTFRIKNMDALFEKLSAVDGVQCLMDPTLLPDGKKAIFLDPDGRAVELVES